MDVPTLRYTGSPPAMVMELVAYAMCTFGKERLPRTLGEVGTVNYTIFPNIVVDMKVKYVSTMDLVLSTVIKLYVYV